MQSQSAKLLQSIITGLLLAGTIWSGYRFWTAPGPGSGFVAAAAIGSFITWVRLSLPRRQVLRKAPHTTREFSSPLRLAFTWDDGNAGTFAEIPIQRGQFIAWCIGVAAGRSLGENHWTGSTGIFSKSEYHSFRDELLARGFIQPQGKHYAQGVRLTSKGAAMTREVARQSRSPSPTPTPSPFPEPVTGLTTPLGGYANERVRERHG